MSDLSIPDLGPFVIVQSALGVVIIGTAVAAWLRGERKPKPKADQLPSGAQIFFDGPLMKAINALDGIYRTLKEIRDENKESARVAHDDAEKQLERLREIAVVRRRR